MQAEVKIKLALTCAANGDSYEAVEHCLACLAVCRGLEDQTREAACLFALGGIYYDAGEVHLLFFFITLKPRVDGHKKSLRLKYEPSSARLPSATTLINCVWATKLTARLGHSSNSKAFV